jgi:chemotaxis signal transduction protein
MNSIPYIQPQQQFLSFALSRDHWVLLSTVQLIEIFQVDSCSITEIPGMLPIVMGVYPTSEELLWIVDLVQLSGLNAAQPPQQCSILKIKSQWGNVGYFVRQVGNLITINSTAIENPNPAVISQSTAPRLQQTWQQGIWINPQGKTLPILDTEAIAHQIQSLEPSIRVG